MTSEQHSAAPALALRTRDAEETRAIGVALGRLLQPGDVVLLQGDLGAGKTTLTQGIARGAGAEEVVNSPTFILLNEYHARLTLYHADLYRLEEPEEVAALDLSGVSLDGALVVEWPERGEGLLPDDHLLVQLAHRGPEERELAFTAHGPRARELAAALVAALATSA